MQMISTPAKPRRSLPLWGWSLLSLLLVLLLWYVFTDVLKLYPPYQLPSPQMVAKEFYYGFFGKAPDGQLGLAVLGSLKRVALGYVVALVLGGVVGIVLSLSEALRNTVGSWLTAIQSVPSIAFVPLAILWFGLNEKAVYFVVILEGFIPIALAVSSALRNVPPNLVTAGRTLGARGLALYTHVLLPASVPSLTTALRTSWSFSWRALIGAELLTANPGLGQILETGRNVANISLVLVAILIVGVVGGLFDMLIRGFETRVRRNYGLEVVK